MKLPALLIATLLPVVATSAPASNELASGIDLSGAVGPSPFVAEPGSGYREGARHLGLQLGYGFGTRALGATVPHDLGLVTFQYGRVFSGVMAPNSWNRGNWELLLEAFAGEQTSPGSAALVGITPVFRYNFATGTSWVPYLECGAGATYSEIREGDLSTDFEFNLLWGFGARVYTSPRSSFNFGYRWLHVSNLGFSKPNKGVDAHVLTLGFSRAF